jgi:hypothetical protein
MESSCEGNTEEKSFRRSKKIKWISTKDSFTPNYKNNQQDAYGSFNSFGTPAGSSLGEHYQIL